MGEDGAALRQFNDAAIAAFRKAFRTPPVEIDNAARSGRRWRAGVVAEHYWRGKS